MAKPAELTTTSYAILGLLAIKPWTTYELAQQMDRAIGKFWPRTRSKLYEEPKKLVAHGLAKATDESVGKRPRTVYAIRPKGRRALKQWVPEPGAGPVLEFEQLLKVFFAEHGTKADLLRGIGALRDWNEREALAAEGVSERYLKGEGEFPERLPWLILVGEFLNRFETLVADWTDWATAIVETWPDDVTRAQPDLATLRRQAQR